MNLLLKTIAKNAIENGNYIVPIIIIILCLVGIWFLAFKFLPKVWKKPKLKKFKGKSEDN